MPGAVTGSVKTILRLEGLCVLLVSLYAYAYYGAGWGLFAACLLLPDLSLLGYLAGPRAGAGIYNAAHSYIGALAALVAALAYPTEVSPSIGLIWCAHIGMDRLFGYGLKYPTDFGHTHLGLIGRAARQAPAPRL